MKKNVVKSVAIAIAISLISVSCGQVVPPGTVVIKLDAGGGTQIYRNGVYKVYGRDRIYFVDTKLKSFTETMRILCKDDVNMTVDVKWVGSFSVKKHNIKIIKEKVPSRKVSSGDIEGYELSLDKFYETAIKDIIRGTSRVVVSPYVTDAIPGKRVEIGEAIKQKVLERLAALNYPVETSDVLLSNLDYPESVQTHREAIKRAQLEDLRQMALAEAAVKQAARDKDIAVERGKALIAQATAKARANTILSKSLTRQILALKQWEVLDAMAKGPNNEVIVIPFEALRPELLPNLINRSALRARK